MIISERFCIYEYKMDTTDAYLALPDCSEPYLLYKSGNVFVG